VLVLQCVEKGLFQLDDPVQIFCPSDWKLDQVLAGFDDQDQPIIEPAKKPLTWRHLCDHTGGCA
jgi:CubicO group peptidase (beta-lactamase class C family)